MSAVHLKLDRLMPAARQAVEYLQRARTAVADGNNGRPTSQVSRTRSSTLRADPAQAQTLSAIALTYLCAALIVAGPWIFTMLGIAGLSAVNCAAPCDQLPLFRTVVIYNSMFSLVMTTPLAFFAGRYAADELHEGRTSHIFGVLAAGLILLAVITLLFAIPLYAFGATFDGATALASVQNALIIGVSWLLIPFLGALRAQAAILIAFGAGAFAMTVFGWTLADPNATTLLTGFNASFAITDAIMMACIVRGIGSDIHLDADLLRQLRRRWDLIACGAAYAVGIWADKVVMWYGSPWHAAPADGFAMAGVLRTMPSYDTAVFWAQLASIPVVAIAFVHVDADLKRLFSQFYDRIALQASLRELTAAVEKLRTQVISSIAMVFVALSIVAIMSILTSFVFMSELGLKPSYMSILRVSLVAMAFHATAMLCFVFLLYFDLRRQAFTVVMSYAVLNSLLTMVFLDAGPTFYGYGSMIAAVATFVLAFIILLRELPWLHYHAFITNNSSL